MPVCVICNKTFKCSQGLSIHHKFVHTSYKHPYSKSSKSILSKLRTEFPNLKFPNQYLTSISKAKYNCPKHGPGIITVSTAFDKRHNKRFGCQKCKGDHAAHLIIGKYPGPPEITRKEWLHRFNLRNHINCTVQFPKGRIKTYTKITVTCSVHGKFYPTAEHYAKDTGCAQCKQEIWYGKLFLRTLGEDDSKRSLKCLQELGRKIRIVQLTKNLRVLLRELPDSTRSKRILRTLKRMTH